MIVTTNKLHSTPGPWTDNKKDHGEPYQPIDINGRFHHVCTIWIDDAPVEDFNREQRANAHLIAAAPELYEALVSAVELLSSAEIQSQTRVRGMAAVIRNGDKALAKARGERS